VQLQELCGFADLFYTVPNVTAFSQLNNHFIGEMHFNTTSNVVGTRPMCIAN